MFERRDAVGTIDHENGFVISMIEYDQTVVSPRTDRLERLELQH